MLFNTAVLFNTAYPDPCSLLILVTEFALQYRTRKSSQVHQLVCSEVNRIKVSQNLTFSRGGFE
jgi:hypothetical protein